MGTSELAAFRVLTINAACPSDPGFEGNKSRRSAISVLINEQNPDIILLQNVNKRRDVEYLDFMLAKVWRHYNFFMKKARRGTVVMARASLFNMEKVVCSDINIVGTAEQKAIIQNNLALVKLTHKSTKNFLYVGSWSCPTNIGMTDEKKKIVSRLLVSMMRRETVSAFWMIGGDFDLPYDESSIRVAQKNQAEFFNLVEDTGRIANADNVLENYFVFSGKSAHRRMTFRDVESAHCRDERQNSLLNCSPLLGTVTITWAAASPRLSQKIMHGHTY